ncbi:hypothetical protein [Salipaludibacillus neizhouensis]|uniref:hypothetical protein n=1 Tax=Salipaludibacillus neizhouensis TaxID=885475 RepID=UPI001603395A|nr:hypothetical protein [Salipaludibacillus neizhouensis]
MEESTGRIVQVIVIIADAEDNTAAVIDADLLPTEVTVIKEKGMGAAVNACCYAIEQ